MVLLSNTSSKSTVGVQVMIEPSFNMLLNSNILVDRLGGNALPIRKFALLGALISLVSCTNPMMPVAGPESGDVRGHVQDADSLPYAFVKLDPSVMSVLATHRPGFAGVFSDRRPPDQIKFGIGDVVAITIFEAAAGGLFIPSEAGVRPGNFVQLPNQAVDERGDITVPYAGAVRAMGRTAAEIQNSIVNALRNRAIEPQVVVSLVTQNTSLISVLGEVNTPSRFAVSAAGEKILDEITRAGGPKGQGFNTWVMLERNGKRATVPFGALVYDPSNNIYARPNDTIYLYQEPQTFVEFGASGQQGQFNFDAWRISLAEAIAKAGGLNDSLADPASVFIYRGESRKFAEELGIDIAKFNSSIIPVVYNVNLRDPAGYFLATKFPMRDKDVIFASNATAVEHAKIMNYIRLVTATVNDPIVAATNGVVLRDSVKASLGR
jgi:polysaccharide biosynthesis/export protein